MNEESSQLKIGATLNYINMALGSLIPLLYTPVMLRILGQDEYGLYKLSGSITGYLGLLSLGIGSAIIRNLIKARTEGGHDMEQKVFSLFVMIYRIIGLVTIVVGMILVFNIDRWYGESIQPNQMVRMQTLVAIMVLHSSLSLMMGPYYSIIVAHERFVYAQSVGIIFTILGPALNLVALFFGYASIGLAVTSLLTTLLSQIIYRIYVMKSLQIHIMYRNLPWYLAKEILYFSFWIFLGELTSLLYNSTDNLLIGSRAELGTNAVAIYSIGCVMTSMIFSFTTGISSVLAPRVNKMCFEGASNSELTDFAIKVGRIQLLIVTLCISGFIALGVPFLELYAGEGYSSAYYVTLLTVIPLVPSLVQNVFLNVSMARFQHQFRSIVYLLIAVVNVVGTYLVLPSLGIVGAALITGIAGVIGRGFVMNWYYDKKMHLETTRFWKNLYKIFIMPALLAAVGLALLHNVEFSLIGLFVAIVIYAFLLCILQFAFFMDEYEKGLITKMFSKVKIIK